MELDNNHMDIGPKTALLVVDMQNDFLPGGALAVPKGDEIITPINQIVKQFFDKNALIIFSQDWHPTQHRSFASAYPDKNPFDPIDLPGIGPVLWPDHCVQGTTGAEINNKIDLQYAHCIIRKGYNPMIDSYSIFYENDKKTKTGLAGFLKDREVETIYICGLALDYCCYYSAMDAKKDGFNVYLIEGLTRGIDNPKDNIKNSLNSMRANGIHII
ncbi:MAG: bifunctional nicotinamidase/pyrazinamidase [Promethearchaeota archaeon]